MKKLIKMTLRMVALILAVTIPLTREYNILKPKGGSGIYDLLEFYELEDNSVDVLMLGSSLSFINIDPAILWDKYGISAYTLGGAVQPLWNTYYYLNEALKTQTPKLITLEVYCAQEEDSPNNHFVLNNISAIRSFDNRLGSVLSSTTSDEWISMFFGFPYFHDRYSQLSYQDYLPHRGQTDFEYYLGHGTFYKTKECEEPDRRSNAEPEELPQKSELYLRKIIEVCKNNNIDILLFASPTCRYSELQGSYMSVIEIAKEYNVPYIDFNECYEEMDIDFEKDFADENHLNQFGCPKFSSYFADYINREYDIPDHTMDGNKYCRWNQANSFRKRMESDYSLHENDNLGKKLSMITDASNDQLIAYLWVTGRETESVKGILEEYNVPSNEGLYEISGLEVEYIDEEKSIDIGPDIYTVTNEYVDKNAREWIDVGDNFSIICMDIFTRKVIDASFLDESGHVIGHPIDIIWNWVGAGD